MRHILQAGLAHVEGTDARDLESSGFLQKAPGVGEFEYRNWALQPRLRGQMCLQV